ncbi:helix-turn-helix transcriptional regulator [Sphaerisporangium sp. B11E5]|uniref:helix-turn-helix transcriptional regulator n=1 Tax=Sphaerisporangium sp. B11E5 TaxID=3153563 RepID=UPI00325C5501
MVRPRLQELSPRERAGVLDRYGVELHHADRPAEAVTAAWQAAEAYRHLGDPTGLATCLALLSRHLLAAGRTGAAEAAAEEASRLTPALAGRDVHARVLLARGLIEAAVGEHEAAVRLLAEAAARAGDDEPAALCSVHLAAARAEIDGEDAFPALRAAVTGAVDARRHEAAAAGHALLAESLLRFGRRAELEDLLRDGLPHAERHGFLAHAHTLRVLSGVSRARSRDWPAAERDLRAAGEPCTAAVAGRAGTAALLAGAWHWRLAARRGHSGAGTALARTWETARRGRVLVPCVHAGLAYAEWGRLNGLPGVVQEVADALLPRLTRPGAAPYRAELLLSLTRAGLAAEPFTGCPPAHEAGIRGDRPAAADLWAAAGDPYEQAAELALGAGVAQVDQAIVIFDRLGASAAARLAVRRRATLTGSAARRRPVHPAGLTDRQATVLALLTEHLTNAEIAERLVLSVRTVDHHVAAVLGKLGVRSRREAAIRARALGFRPLPAAVEARSA